MENASKALLIAGGVLIGIMVLAIGMYLFITFGNYSAEVHDNIAKNQLTQFNSQFTKFNGKKDTTIYDIITVANLAKDNNEKYELTSEDANKEESLYIYVRAKINNTWYSDLSAFQNNVQNKMSKEIEDGNTPKYTCTVSISSVTGRVYKVEFKPTP